jgi:uncharacterized protein YjbI with pentapeptide repeats
MHEPSALEAELKRIGDEGTIDARGVILSADLLARILDAAPHEADRRVIKAAQFDRATFQGGAPFDGTIFRGEVWFSGAVFQGGAWFSDVTFQGEAAFAGTTFQREARFGAATFKRWARFTEATFGGGAWFDGVNFQQVAGFDRARFQGEAWFNRATFKREAGFGRTIFERVTVFAGATFQHAALFARTEFQDEVGFGGATFRREARFDQANFLRPRQVGPLVARKLALDGAVFGERVQIEAATAVLCARGVKFSAGSGFGCDGPRSSWTTPTWPPRPASPAFHNGRGWTNRMPLAAGSGCRQGPGRSVGSPDCCRFVALMSLVCGHPT